jgi:excisionase family DNA binding protein
MQVDRTRMYRVPAVAELLDVSKSTVYRAIESGELDALRIGTSLRIPGTALAAWLEECAQAAYEHHVLAGESAADTDSASGPEVSSSLDAPATATTEPVEVAAR